MVCTLCPRLCRADRSARAGFCGLGEEMRIARVAPHLWEEPGVLQLRDRRIAAKPYGALFFCKNFFVFCCVVLCVSTICGIIVLYFIRRCCV